MPGPGKPKAFTKPLSGPFVKSFNLGLEFPSLLFRIIVLNIKPPRPILNQESKVSVSDLNDAPIKGEGKVKS